MSSELCYIENGEERVSVEMNARGTLILTVNDIDCDAAITFKSSEIEKVETLISALQEWVKHVKEDA